MQRLRDALKSCLSALVVVGVLVAIIVVATRRDKAHPWMGSFYAHAGADGTYTAAPVSKSGKFSKLSECRTWGDDLVDGADASDAGYTCGTGCTYEKKSYGSGRAVNTYTCTTLHTYPVR